MVDSARKPNESREPLVRLAEMSVDFGRHAVLRQINLDIGLDALYVMIFSRGPSIF